MLDRRKVPLLRSSSLLSLWCGVQARDRTYGLVVHGRRTVAHFTNDNAADSQRQHIADPCAIALVATSVDSADNER